MSSVWLQIVVVLWAVLSTESVLGIGRSRGFDLSMFRMMWLQLAAMGLFSLLFHETGHWAAGRAVGWRCLFFRVGPFKLVQRAAGWRIQWTKWDFGGGVACVPPSHANFRLCSAWFTAGGPAASLLQALLFGFAAWGSSSPAAFWLFAFLAHFGTGACLLSLVPTRQGFRSSDGEKLWRLFRGGRLLDQHQRMYLINISFGGPMRPRDWPGELIGPVLDARTACSRHDRYLAYIHLLDLDGPQAAYPWLARYAKEWSKTDPYEYAVEAAYYLGVYARDPAGAALWLARALKDKSIMPADRLRADAAMAFAAGRLDQAGRAIRAALASLDDELPSGMLEYRRARLHYLFQQVSSEAAPVSA